MKTIVKDMFLSVLLGMVLPGILLNGMARLMEWTGEIIPEAAARDFVTEPEADTAYPPQALQAREELQGDQDVEDYLIGVVLAEMPASFEVEALKAQAVAARTYTVKARQTGGKHGDGSVCADPQCCQAYLDPESYLVKGGTRENLEKVSTAVRETAGQVLTYEGELIEATYFSCSGGSTEDAKAVWGADFPYLQAVESPGEEAAAWYRDKVAYTGEEFQEKLGVTLEGDPMDWFGETTYTEGGGVASMEIGEDRYAGTLLRSALGLRSTAFSVTVGEKITITTRGYGHRVGMSQYGADAMAVAGSTYREILAHYYTGTQITYL